MVSKYITEQIFQKGLKEQISSMKSEEWLFLSSFCVIKYTNVQSLRWRDLTALLSGKSKNPEYQNCCKWVPKWNSHVLTKKSYFTLSPIKFSFDLSFLVPIMGLLKSELNLFHPAVRYQRVIKNKQYRSIFRNDDFPSLEITTRMNKVLIHGRLTIDEKQMVKG